jgi:hypothetical protein
VVGWERTHEREREVVCVRERNRERECVCMCVCEREGGGGRAYQYSVAPNLPPELPMGLNKEHATQSASNACHSGSGPTSSASSPNPALRIAPPTLVFGRNLQCEPVRNVDNRDKCHWPHAWQCFNRAGVGTNGILECRFLRKNAHRTSS